MVNHQRVGSDLNVLVRSSNCDLHIISCSLPREKINRCIYICVYLCASGSGTLGFALIISNHHVILAQVP